jgi:hypothetical protein
MSQLFRSFLIACVVWVSSGLISYAHAAPSISVTIDGTTYQCTQGGGSTNTTCWKACPIGNYGFAHCVNRCGGGEDCWAACPIGNYGFDYCVSQCGNNTNQAEVLGAKNSVQSPST